MYKENELSAKKINENITRLIEDISKEFQMGFDFIRKYPKSVTIFGSSRLTDKSSHYHDAQRLAMRISGELGYCIVTGGGLGIMEAANRGAYEAKGASIGLNISIKSEQNINKYMNDSIRLNYFFARKALLGFAAEVFVFFPGGFGTFDELFNILTLIQTGKIPKVPVILFGKDFWNPTVEFIKTNMLEKHHTIEPEDMNIFVITDSVDTVIKIIKEAPVSAWWKMVD